ncbi:PREDICTED: sex comb on midleg-like protein 1 [Galeopterus variegatus]|uniref:Sex comb on midleg-like protein 1 n=1 Tax=Galeopterus variegatus TaxID=482537 RepID=A0ABM0QWC5_GALVR|nr:PREDICTED: sex comb on midleg-like protein 1 [Galeopterus variegatus]
MAQSTRPPGFDVLSRDELRKRLQQTSQDRGVLDTLKGVCEAIGSLDKKLDVVHGKVSKIQRLHAKALRRRRKLSGYASRNSKYWLSRRSKFQKMRKKGSPSSFSYHESYSPTSPVRRREIDYQSIPEGVFNQSDDSQETDQESLLMEQEQKEREMFFSLSPRRFRDELRKRLQQTSQDRGVLDTLKGVCEAIGSLDKKLNVVHGKVSKIQRLHAKALRRRRKLSGYASRNSKYWLFRRSKFQKMRKKGSPSSFSYHESYSPTSPVRRREIDYQSIPEGVFNQSDDSQETDQESLLMEQEQKEREMFFSLSPRRLSANPYQPPVVPDNPLPGTSLLPSYTSPRAVKNSSILPNAPAFGAAPAGLLTQGDSSSIYTREMKSHSVFLRNKHTVSSICVPSGFATSSPVEPDLYVSEDPSAWSVDEVILFLQHTDPQTLGPLSNLFRHDEIDGKALLLLTADMMINYMGLKLGTAVKLCHYIESLKRKNSTIIEENVSV